MKHLSNQKAFTLVELLVVVLIIGVLSAIAMPQYTKSVEKSRAAEAIQLLRYMHQQGKLCEMQSGEDACANLSNRKLGIGMPSNMTCTYNNDESERCCAQHWCYENNGVNWGTGSSSPAMPAAIRATDTSSLSAAETSTMGNLEYHDDGLLYCVNHADYCKLFNGINKPVQ